MQILTRSDKVGAGPYDSIKWALETHVGAQDHGEYNFAVLIGNEDSPKEINFWKSENPDYTDIPDYTWQS